MRTVALLSLFLTLTLGTQQSFAQTDNDSDKSGFSVATTIDFAYQRSKPRYINGVPHRDHEYWSYVDKIEARFSRPVNYVSLLGSVVAKGEYVTDRPFTIASISQDAKTVVFKPVGSNGICADRFTHDRVEFKGTIRDVSGSRMTTRSFRLAYGPGRDRLDQTRISTTPEMTAVPDSNTSAPSFAPAAAEEDKSDTSDCQVRSGKMCLTNLSPSSDLTVAKINDVYLRIRNWVEREKMSAEYQREAIQKLKTSDTIIVPRGPSSSQRHFGLPDVLFTVRKSAKFVEWLFPNLASIGVADLTTPEGDTPYMSWPDGSRQYLHPFGSHQGEDVDIGYISVGNGNDRNQAIDIEKSFWLLYAALQSSGVDLVYTAHKDYFVEYARKARDRGLINDVAYGRFRSARIIKDQNLGHDTHFHFKVSYRDYNGESLRFLPENDVYNCLLGLSGSGMSEQNFCRNL